MNTNPSDNRLSRISTLWSLVSLAHHELGDEANAAQRQLLERYGGAIRRYLLGALRDANAADDLFQEFAYRFLHGDMRRVDPTRGRFRDYVKGVLFHLVADYHKKRQRQPGQIPLDCPDPAVTCEPDADQEQAFRTSWRDELLSRAWAALETLDHRFHAVLRYRAEHPEQRSQEMAERLSELLGKSMTAAGVRKTLERARDRFADLLLDEIAQSLTDPTADKMEEELVDLKLLEHCREALERRRGT